MLVQQLWGGTVHWTQLPVYLAAELPRRRRRSLGVHVSVSRTSADLRAPNNAADLVPVEA